MSYDSTQQRQVKALLKNWAEPGDEAIATGKMGYAKRLLRGCSVCGSCPYHLVQHLLSTSSPLATLLFRLELWDNLILGSYKAGRIDEVCSI